MGWCLRRRLQTLAWQIETNNLCFIATFDSGHSEDPAAKTLDGAAGGSLGGVQAAWVEVGLTWGLSAPHHVGSHTEGQEGKQGL